MVAAFVLIACKKNPDDRALPYVVLTGSDSAVTTATCMRVTTDEQWQALWERHTADDTTNVSEFATNRMPEIDFTQCMVIAIFGGKGWNTYGLRFISSEDRADSLVLGIDWLTYQTKIQGDSVSPFGFLILPRTSKALVLEYDNRNLMERAQHVAPIWVEFHRFPEIM